MKNRNLIYGVAIGGAISLAMLISYLTAGDPPDFGMMEMVGYSSMILALLGIVFGIRARRDAQGGTISMGEAIKTGVMIAGVAGLVVGVYTFVSLAWIDPDYIAKYMEYEEQRMIADGASISEIEAAQEEYESMRGFFENPFLQGLVMAATVFVIGAFISIIAAFFLKRRDPESGTLRTA